MLLKGNQRGGAKQMAVHLLNGEENEHVRVAEVSGFVAHDVVGALNEIYATSKGTKCKQFMYSLSLSPPQDKDVPDHNFDKAIEKIEKKLGLEGQPRLVVYHEKKGRRHAHCVWSRIDIEKMKAIPMSFDRDKLHKLSKSLYLEHGWRLPDGFIDKSRKNPLNFSREEWQQAMRVGKKPGDIKAEFQEAWCISDNRTSFEHALAERGYALARGDRRGFVAIDVQGEVFSLNGLSNVKKKDMEQKLGKPSEHPSIADTQKEWTGRLSALFTGFSHELNADHEQQRAPLLREKEEMIRKHREVRAGLKAFQEERWQKEENTRASRVRKGFKGLFDKLSGRYWKTRKQNEREAYAAFKRDQKQYEKLVFAQGDERRELEQKIQSLEKNHYQERQELIKDLAHVRTQEQIEEMERENDWFKDYDNDHVIDEFGVEHDAPNEHEIE